MNSKLIIVGQVFVWASLIWATIDYVKGNGDIVFFIFSAYLGWIFFDVLFLFYTFKTKEVSKC